VTEVINKKYNLTKSQENLMAKKVLFIDPVCGMKIDPSEHSDSLHTINYNRKDYYFCSPFCTAIFLEDPDRYASGNYEVNDENHDNEDED